MDVNARQFVATHDRETLSNFLSFRPLLDFKSQNLASLSNFDFVFLLVLTCVGSLGVWLGRHYLAPILPPLCPIARRVAN